MSSVALPLPHAVPSSTRSRGDGSEGARSGPTPTRRARLTRERHMRHYSSRKPPTPILTHILQEDQILGWEIRSRDWGRQRSGLLVSTGATTSGARHPGTVPPAQGRRIGNLIGSRRARSTAYTEDVRDDQGAVPAVSAASRVAASRGTHRSRALTTAAVLPLGGAASTVPGARLRRSQGDP